MALVAPLLLCFIPSIADASLVPPVGFGITGPIGASNHSCDRYGPGVALTSNAIPNCGGQLGYRSLTETTRRFGHDASCVDMCADPGSLILDLERRNCNDNDYNNISPGCGSDAHYTTHV